MSRPPDCDEPVRVTLTDEINDGYLRGYKDGKDFEAMLLDRIRVLEASLAVAARDAINQDERYEKLEAENNMYLTSIGYVRILALEELLRRALPDLKWAQGAAESEWSSGLDDADIISDIEKCLQASEVGK